MKRAICRPALLTTAVLQAFPLSLLAQSAPPAASPAPGPDATAHDMVARRGRTAQARADRAFMRETTGACGYAAKVSVLGAERAQNAPVQGFSASPAS